MWAKMSAGRLVFLVRRLSLADALGVLRWLMRRFGDLISAGNEAARLEASKDGVSWTDKR
jgi:hypothetical protein